MILSLSKTLRFESASETFENEIFNLLNFTSNICTAPHPLIYGTPSTAIPMPSSLQEMAIRWFYRSVCLDLKIEVYGEGQVVKERKVIRNISLKLFIFADSIIVDDIDVGPLDIFLDKENEIEMENKYNKKMSQLINREWELKNITTTFLMKYFCEARKPIL